MTSRPSRFSRRTLVLSIAALSAAPAGFARAQGMLDSARAAGQVGERFDGYAAVHGAAPANVQSLVEQVNGERRTLYAERAAAQKVPVDAIGRIYAAEILRKLPPGSWVLGEDGRWRQK